MLSRLSQLALLSLLLLSMGALSACQSEQEFNPNEAEIIGEEEAILTLPPHVPPPIDRDHATKLIVNMEVTEEVMELADGVEYMMWTFGGSVPGKFIRAREGDMIEFHLQNHPDNRLPHNIDLHAVNGPGGGAESSFTAPGQETVFTFRALNPGLYIYHCATAPVGMHVANGMYGLILIEPHDGLPEVDREFYVLQSEFYTEGPYGERGLQPFSMEKAIQEIPDYVVFNGSVNAMMGDNAIVGEAGENIRLFVGNDGPKLSSSFVRGVYVSGCHACHMADGSGIQRAFPPVPESDYLEDVDASISAILHGLQGEIVVNGETYNGVMPRQNLDNEEVANVVTFVLNSFGNDGGMVTPDDVQRVRDQ